MVAMELTGISKSFDGFHALSNASFSVRAGEIHALMGENGAGKSTLMNVATGLYRPDSGRIRIGSRDVAIDGPMEAKRLGIGMVHQHYKLVRSFSAIENILLASNKGRYSTGLTELEAILRRQSKAIGFEVDLSKPVGSLSVAEQQRVEILKVLVGGARILVLDEPSAVLTDIEAEALFTTVRALARSGSAVVLVTHKLGEVMNHADRVTVMRRGETVATIDPRSASTSDLTALVVGEAITETRHPAKSVGKPVLTVTGLASDRGDGHRSLSEASFEVRSGEIYGMAGVGGNGQTELAEVLMGVRLPRAGRIDFVDAGDITRKSPARRRDLGFAVIPADRHTYGLAGDLSISDNYSVHGVRTGRLGGWAKVMVKTALARTRAAVDSFDVQGVRSLHQKVSLLSGGNAQKLVIAREFATPPRLVVAHSPSRGLDVRATKDVHRRLIEARDNGAGVLLISEDLDEIMLLSDRIGVMSGGRVVAEFSTPADRQAIGMAMVHHG